MLLTFKIKQDRDFRVELAKARRIAEFALQTGSMPSTGKVHKFGKEAPHIRRKYSKMRRHLYLHGHPRVAKKKIKHKENHKVKDINHKISKEIVNIAAHKAAE